MNYSVTTTENIKNNTQLPTGLAVGDVLETSGYYASNDGGAGTFAVRAKGTGETADNMFTYALDNNLIAELHTPNGVVNVDQLGAKGDGTIPSNYNHANASNLGSANSMASDDVDYLNAALARTTIQRIELTASKKYVVKSTISCVSGRDIAIDGDPFESGAPASILQFQSGIINTVNLQNNAHVQLSNISILGYPYNGVIGCTGGNLLKMENVTIYSSMDGILFYHTNTPHLANMKRCRIFARYTALECDSVAHSSFEDLTIAPSYIMLTTGISLFEDNCCNRFRNISITGHKQNERHGWGISSSTGNYGNLFENIHIDSFNSAISPGSMNAVFDRILATNWNNAIDISMSVNITIQNSAFLADGKHAILYNGLQCKNVVIRHCLFETTESWVQVSPINSNNIDSISVHNCTFRLIGADNPTAVTSCIRTTVQMDGSFSDCLFEVEEYPLTATHTQGNAALFCFTSETGSHEQSWVFSGCRFVQTNQNMISLNSPIRIDAQNREYIRVLVADCLLDGFRWTMRVSGANETESYVSSAEDTTVIINPAFDGWPSDTSRAAAVERFAQLDAFGTSDNLYICVDAQNSPCYRAAEEVGFID